VTDVLFNVSEKRVIGLKRHSRIPVRMEITSILILKIINQSDRWNKLKEYVSGGPW